MKSYLISNAKTDCSGCGACADICSKKCITLEDDEYGFKYPVINKADCISCGLCQRVCPFQSSSFRTKNDAFYGKSADDETIRRSSSGGAFTELYHEFMCSGGIVYGVEFDKEIRTVYGRATSVEECQRFRKSKYVLAETEHCFSKVCNDLREGRDVLFSGTPCICSALNNYLALRRVSTENLLTVEMSPP